MPDRQGRSKAERPLPVLRRLDEPPAADGPSLPAGDEDIRCITDFLGGEGTTTAAPPLAAVPGVTEPSMGNQGEAADPVALARFLDDPPTALGFSPLRPLRFTDATLAALGWARNPEGERVLGYLLARGMGFPSVPLAFAARPGLDEIAKTFAQHLTHLGLNVFLPADLTPVPIAALSITMVARRLPVGLYLDRPDNQDLSLLVLGSHGGAVDNRDVESLAPGEPLDKNGVIGEIAMAEAYAERFAGLLDPFPGPNRWRVAVLDNPFTALAARLRARGTAVQPLFERVPVGPTAMVSADGQRLTLLDSDGKSRDVREITRTLVRYLTGAREATGTVIGPEPLWSAGGPAADPAHHRDLVVQGDWLDVAHQAGFSDLLLAWATDGFVAHQGHAPFGDALLTLAYLIEAASENA